MNHTLLDQVISRPYAISELALTSFKEITETKAPSHMAKIMI